ncbi:MAG TPA: hypothetical protein VGP72_03470 [Planctomycetota bacterium]|jgi:enamine deaminase RidA (YjgF/YER057c/UK114 family)
MSDLAATSACIDTRVIRSGDAVELYITVLPAPGAPVVTQAKEAFSGIARLLKAHEACILEERVVGTAAALQQAAPIRASAYGSFDDGVPPTWLAVAPGFAGPLAGVQIHAVAGVGKPEPLVKKSLGSGRILKVGERKYVTLSQIQAPEAGEFGPQSKRAFEKAEELVTLAGGDFYSIARTWWFLKDIDRDYAEFNKVRREFFLARKLLGECVGDTRLPASTGIGIAPGVIEPVLKKKKNGKVPQCCVDIMAVFGGPQQATKYYPVAGNQHSAFNYGSAFSRGARAQMPAGEVGYISGTADIDTSGASGHIGDPRAQITETLANVKAVIKDIDCRDNEVVQGIAYCKTPEVERVWNELSAELDWPIITCIADVCRPELLFELEAAACPGARSL